MYCHAFLLVAYGLWAITASPFAFPSPDGVGKGADSCPTKPLTNETWMELDMDTFIIDAAKNFTPTTTNNVQALAQSFGAPNFFCGLDAFCNAGQPCLPVMTPAWYAMVAIQNWNAYMNSLHTAVMFASSIMSLIIPQVVNDFHPNKKVTETPLRAMMGAFSLMLSYVPFTGEMAVLNQQISNFRFTGVYSFNMMRNTAQFDKFMSWSNVGASLGEVVQDYQHAISVEIKRLVDSPIDAKDGLGAILAGGQFLGVAQNFSQAALQERVTDVITRRAISLVLQEQKAFIFRFPNNCNHENDHAAQMCVDGGDKIGGMAGYLLIKPSTVQDNANSLDLQAELLMSKYGMTKDQIFLGPVRCFDTNGKKQLADPFGDMLPADKNTDCLFNLQVCGMEEPGWKKGLGIIENCRRQGLNLKVK